MEMLRYAAAACQVDQPNPTTRSEIKARTAHMLGMTRMACPEPAMSIEIAFAEALQSAATVASNDSRMALRNSEGQATARFDAIKRVE